MRYIDADALKDRMLNYYGCVNANTSKSNYRGETLMNYEVADMIEDCIDNAPTADVAPKSEVARLEIELERAQRKGFPSYLQACSEEEAIKIGREYGKAEVAREIFAEMESCLDYIEEQLEDIPDAFLCVKEDLATLKKKYAEGENDE